jgi:uncharacterized membrane protein YeaQ/YmgE (transglycosylase-associated protein family)
MSILIALLIGAGLGTVTGLTFKRNGDYMVIDLVVGVAGSLVGMALYAFTNLQSGFFSLSGIFTSAVCAAVFLAIYQLILKIPKHKKLEDH